MTSKQALTQARKRWGKKTAMVSWKDHALTAEEKQKLEPKDEKRFLHKASVGRVMMGMFFEVLGEGDTWEEAFRNADKRAEDDKARYAR